VKWDEDKVTFIHNVMEKYSRPKGYIPLGKKGIKALEEIRAYSLR